MKKNKLILLLMCICFALAEVNANLPFVYADDGDTAYSVGSAVQIEEQFDTKSGMYTQTIGRGLEFMSSVPNGSVVSDGVYFEMPSNINTQLQKDGEYITFVNKTPITAAGYYILRLSGSDMYGEQLTGVFTFRVGLPPSGGVKTSEYRYPKISTAAAPIYDGETGMYKYTFPNYKAFFTDVSGSGEEVERFSLIIPGNLGYSLKRNGSETAYLENKIYTQPGDYTLKVYDYSYASGGGYEACYEIVLKFSIADPNKESAAASAAESVGGEISSIISGGGDKVSSVIDSLGEKLENDRSEVISDTLSEDYYEAANIYSQAFSTGDAFYTNIANDSIVGGNVYFDLPYNMNASLTKDGVNVEFKNKTYINTAGSYVLTVTDEFDDTVSEAKFSFRIQSGTEIPDDISQKSNEDSDDGDEEKDGKEKSGKEKSGKENKDEESDEEEEEEVAYDVTNQYDAGRGMYVFSCGGDNVYMSVPDGGVSNYDVKLDMSDYIDKTLTINGEEAAYENTLNQDGSYVLNLKNGKDELTLKFYIVSEPVNFLDEIIVPEGYSLLIAEYTDYMSIYSDTDTEYIEGLDQIDSQSKDYVKEFSLPLDGEYDFVMQGRDDMPIISFALFIDRIAPEVKFEGLDDTMSTQDESIIISCDEDDAVITLTDSKGEESVLDISNGVTQVSGKGNFTLTSRDKAGNENTYEFTLGRSAAAGRIKAIIVLILFAAVLAAIVIVIIKIFRGTLFGGKSGKKEKKEKKEKTKKDKPKKEKKEKKEKGGIFKKSKAENEAAASADAGGLDFSDAEEDSFDFGSGLDFSDAEEDSLDLGGGLDFSAAEEDSSDFGSGLDFSDTEDDSSDSDGGLDSSDDEVDLFDFDSDFDFLDDEDEEDLLDLGGDIDLSDIEEDTAGSDSGLDFSDAEEDSAGSDGGLDFSDAEEDSDYGSELDFSDAEEDSFDFGGGLDFSDMGDEEDDDADFDDGSGMIGGRLNFTVSDDENDDDDDEEDW